MTRRIVATCLVLIAVAARSAHSEQASPRDLWPQATAAAQSGNLDSASRKAGQLIDTGRAYNIRTYPLYAESAASLARDADQQKNKALSDWSAATSMTLDPNSPEVAFALAERARDQKNWSSALQLILAGFTKLFGNYRALVLSRSDAAITVCLAFVLTAAIFAIVLFFRYFRAAAHDFRELLSRRFRGGSVTVLAFAFLFLPIFFWLGPLWLMLYWFVIFFGYAVFAERVAIIVLLLLTAVTPVILDYTANEIAGLDSPVVVAALASAEQTYVPEALRRLQELSLVAGDNARMSILLGNLHLQEGNQSQAAQNYRKSVALADTAGVHVNIGNLHFLDNDFPAAITEYQKAEKLDPSMAIAFYNHSVASGETYKYDEQAQMQDQAKKIDRALVDRLISNPPGQKVVMYHPSLAESRSLARSIARKGNARELFGSYSWFQPMASLLNPVTLGAILAMALSLLLWLRRRKSGYAGACIKCGRTFCHRCKSSRESATYCTQCIHIYLRRDGVSLDTKRRKLLDVQEYLSGRVRLNRLFATFLPGSAQLLEGTTVAGIIELFLFFCFLSLLLLVGRLAPVLAPGMLAQIIVRIIAGLAIVVIWLIVSLPVYRRRVTG
jgi:tetratricopeptide (TPR) repeat protein